MGLSDGELVELARAGDPAALRLCGDPHDADDIAQESLLQAFIALDRLHDPDRFAGWLAGIVLNVHRAHRRSARLLLLADWPERLHPVSEHGRPSAEDLDRADAVRDAVAGLAAPPNVLYVMDEPGAEGQGLLALGWSCSAGTVVQCGGHVPAQAIHSSSLWSVHGSPWRSERYS